MRKPSTKKRRAAQRMKNRRGASVVEFALVAPLMILMTMGMMEVGRAVMVKQLLVNASREGARLAVLPGSTVNEVTTRVQDDLAASSVNGVTVNITPTMLSAAGSGTPVTVEVQVEAASISWIPKPVFTINKTLVGSTTMRKESL